jgi:nucleoside-triphosphatase THEP1
MRCMSASYQPTQKEVPVAATDQRFILWIGEKHSGKTTNAAKLVQIVQVDGFKVAGVLALSLYRDGKLIGFDVLDLRSEIRAPLARRKMDGGNMSPFLFIDDGLRLGSAALNREATESADLVVVDEFGPLEIAGQGWRSSVDSLVASISATILLVVRRELVNPVQRVYADSHWLKISVGEPTSLDRVIRILGRRRGLLREAT